MRPEVLRAIVFLHRIDDDQDFNEVVNCIPDSRMKVLEEGLRVLRDAGKIDTVQIGRHRKETHPLSIDEDQVDKFFDKIDSRLRSLMHRMPLSESGDSDWISDGASKFTGFDDVTDR